MARKVLLTMTDDLDGETTATETVEFSPDGRTRYEIDLSEDNARELRDTLARYTAVARKVGTAQSGRRSSRPKTNGDPGVSPQAVRAWAKANDIPVNERGRIKADVVEQFKAAGN
jgi:hypothetical protein